MNGFILNKRCHLLSVVAVVVVVAMVCLARLDVRKTFQPNGMIIRTLLSIIHTHPTIESVVSKVANDQTFHWLEFREINKMYLQSK